MGQVLQTEYKMMRAWKNQNKSWSQIHDSEVFLDFRARMYSLLVGMDEVFGGSVSYLWMPGLLAGFTEEEARAVVHEAILEHLGQEKLAVQQWVSPDGQWGGPVERGIYLSPEMKDLFRCLADNGVDAYICSASLELIVEELACDPQLGLGLSPERVFGLRFEPAQPLVAAYDSTYTQPIGPGKVTCIETLIAPSYKGIGPVLVAGDSNSDVPMLTAFPDTRHGLIIDVGRKADSPIGALAAEARTSNQSKYLLQPNFATIPGAVEGGGI
jgi:phosphoserine phosphatase